MHGVRRKFSHYEAQLQFLMQHSFNIKRVCGRVGSAIEYLARGAALKKSIVLDFLENRTPLPSPLPE